jgi:hypothetical protein
MRCRSAISPGPVGFHPRFFRVFSLEATRSAPANMASHPKCSAAFSGGRETTGSFKPRPMVSTISRIGNAFFGHRIILRACFMLLQRKPVRRATSETWRRRPAVASFPRISRHAFITRRGDQVGDKPLLDRVVNLRKTHHRSVDALQRQSRLLRNTRGREIRRHHMVFGRHQVPL